MEKIRFLHIPKTAGTSFSNCLRRIYRANRLKNNVFVFLGDFQQDLARYKRLELVERSRIVLISGHAPLVTGVEEIDRMPTIAFLRDPVERIKSLCQHIAEGKTDGLSPENFDLAQTLKGEGNVWFQNMQARMLLGVRGYEFPPGGTDQVVQQALKVLTERLAGFGVTEFFDDSLLLFQKVLGWPNTPVYTRLNQKNPGKALLFSDRQLDLIRETNAIDIRLYDAAVRIFKERISAAATEIESRRRLFSLRQNLYQPVLSLYKLYHRGQIVLSRNRGKPES